MAEPYFAHENLEVYAVGLEFLEVAEQISRGLPKSKGQSGDQLRRASESIVLRMAEGAALGRRSPEQRRHFRAALASANECAAVLDVARAYGVLSAEGRKEGRRLLGRILAMLTRLLPRD